VLDPVGAEYGIRAMTFAPKATGSAIHRISLAWVFASGEAVSSGTLDAEASTDSILPVFSTDQVRVFNASGTKATVHISTMSGKKLKTITLEKQSSASEIVVAATTFYEMVRITSDQPIYVSASDDLATRYTPAIHLK
jgi:hypothetical protein